MGIHIIPGDIVDFTVWGINGNTVRLNLAITPEVGDPYILSFDVVANLDRSSSNVLGRIQDKGEIESANVINIQGTSGGGAGPGETYLLANIRRSGTPGRIVMLLHGYLYLGHAPSFPGLLEPPDWGAGRVRYIVTADPAAGVEVALQAVPTGGRWNVQTYSVQLVQGITQTPLPTLRIRGNAGANIAAQIPITTVAISASSTAQLTWGRGLVQSSFTAIVGDEFHTAPLPERLYLLAADDVGTITDGIGANTNYGAALLTVEEWIVPT